MTPTPIVEQPLYGALERALLTDEGSLTGLR